ncbi:heparinase [Opitutaceae bacterium TAV4]|nr:heparinase [Opitutaceae bacterium TAV4]RRK01036.1 heparinase [Opitutaceae bacterium TAV3]
MPHLPPLPALVLLFLALPASVPASPPLPPPSANAADIPRLLLPDSQLPRIREQEKRDPLMAALLEKIRSRATQTLTLPPNTHRSGGASSSHMLEQSRAAAGRIITNAFIYRLDGDPRHLDAARRDLLNVSTFPDWNPRHYLDTAEMGFGVAIGYSWLHDKLDATDRATISDALNRHLLVMAPAAYARNGRSGLNWSAFNPRSDKTTNNWNFVCNGGFIATALALRHEQQTLADTVLAGARDSLPLAMAGYAPDGAWPEGPTYWNYGTGFLVNSLAMLAAETPEGDATLARLPGFDRTLSYALQLFGPSGTSFNFGDGGPVTDREVNLAALTWLAHRFNAPEAIPEIRRRLHKNLSTPPNAYQRSLPPGGARGLVFCAIFFPETPVPANANAPVARRIPLDAHFRGDADFVVMRSRADDPNALWVAVKGGRNGISHGHLDLGSFVLDAGGLRWAVDLGSESYGLPGYWEMQEGGRRWNYYRLNNHSHNTLTLGNALQSPTATAPVIATNFADPRVPLPATPSATVDLTAAYPKLADKLLRHVSMPDRKAVLIEDEVTSLRPGESLTWRMLTPARVTLSPDGLTAMLHQKGKTLRAELITKPLQSKARFTTAPARPPTQAEKQNEGITALSIVFEPAPSDALPASVRLSVRFTLTPGIDG